MALQFSVETLDNIPEHQRELYSETETGFQLSIEGYQDPTKLKSALNSERDAAKRFGKENENWNKLGKTHDEIAALIAQSEQMADDKAASAGEWDKLKVQLNDKHIKELASRDDSLVAMQKTVESYLVDAQAASAIAEHKGVTALLMPHVKNLVRVVQVDGEHVARVVDAAGNPQINDKGDYMTISELVATMRNSEVYGRAFDSNAKPGSGANPGSGGQSNGAVKSFSDAKTMAEKTAAIAQKLKQAGR
jgi:hypothetical protein